MPPRTKKRSAPPPPDLTVDADTVVEEAPATKENPPAPKRGKKKPTDAASASPTVKSRKKQTTDEEPAPAPSKAAPTVVNKKEDNKEVDTKGKKGKKGKKDKPSARTPSSYVLFSMEHRKKVLEEKPGLSLGEVSRICGELWSTMDADARKPFTDKAADLKAVRRQEVEKYQSENPKTKRPPSSYLLFSMHQRQEILKNSPNLKIGEISKMCGAIWGQMTPEDKDPWVKKAAELKNV